MTTSLSQEDNLVIQSYLTIALLAELNNNKLLESPFFGEMTFGAPWVKELLREVGIDNQGCAIIALYAMLALPREIVGKAFASEYAAINSFLSANTQHTNSSYRSDRPSIDYIRHIRNAVSHGRIEFRPNDAIVFKDENMRANESFSTELPLNHLGELVGRLQNVHLAYIKNINQRST
jgi:hypothetical protein